MKIDQKINLFISDACHRHDIQSLMITPLDGCDHYDWITTRPAQEAEVQKFSETRKIAFTEEKKLAENKALNIGSRIPAPKKLKLDGGSGTYTPSVLMMASPTFSGEGCRTTCETGDYSSDDSDKPLTAATIDDSDRLFGNASTPMLKAPTNWVSEVENLDLDMYDDGEEVHDDPPTHKRRRLSKEAKREKIAQEREKEREEFGDFYVADGEMEDEEPPESNVYPLRLPTKPQLKAAAKKRPLQSSYSSSDDCEDEEYSETDDYDLQRFNVVKKSEKTSPPPQQQKKQDTSFSSSTALFHNNTSSSSSKLAMQSDGKNSESTPHPQKVLTVRSVKSENNPFGVDEVKYKPVNAFRKRNKGDYETNYADQVHVHVHNKLYSQMSLTKQQTTTSGGGESEAAAPPSVRDREELQTINRELDENFITFLVSHTVTVVGCEIALERCIIDYVVKKQTLNGLHPLEQQEISNWRDIFISIENLILKQVRDQTITKKEILTAALGATLHVTENQFRKVRNEVATNSSISDQDQQDEIFRLRCEANVKNEHAKALTLEAKALLDATLRTTSQKINNAIHYIAIKVCVYWANINNCLDLIKPALLEKYNNKFMGECFLKQQLASAEATGRLLLNAPMCADQPVGSEDINETLDVEEAELKKIMRHDHAEDLTQVIYSVRAKAGDIVELANILWTKAPRTKLSTAVAVKKEKTDGEKGSTNTTQKSTVEGMVVGAAATTVDLTSSLSLSTTTGGGGGGGGGGVQTTLAVTADGKMGIASNGPKQQKPAAFGSSSLNDDFATTAVVKDGSISTAAVAPKQVDMDEDNQMADRGNEDQLSRVRDAVNSYDDVIKAILTGLFVENNTLALEIDCKSKRQFRQHRLELLRFLLTHSQTEDLDAVLLLFSENENIYDLLNCLFYVKVDGLDGTVITGDGYCFYRALYQLFKREQSGYVRTAQEMKKSDKKCNNKAELGSAEHAEFVSFVGQLSQLLKDDKHSVDAPVDQLAPFKFHRDCELLSVLLKKRPGVGLGSNQWGCQSAVPLLNFNVSSLQVLPSSPTTSTEKHLVSDDLVATTRWTRFQSSSIPTKRPASSTCKSALSFQDLDMIAAAPFNPVGKSVDLAGGADDKFNIKSFLESLHKKFPGNNSFVVQIRTSAAVFTRELPGEGSEEDVLKAFIYRKNKGVKWTGTKCFSAVYPQNRQCFKKHDLDYMYVGDICDGEEHGQGTRTAANGTVYVGEWRNGFMEGYGTMVDAEDGTRYTGNNSFVVQIRTSAAVFTRELPGEGSEEDVLKAFIYRKNKGVKWTGTKCFSAVYPQNRQCFKKHDLDYMYVGDICDGEEHGQGTRTAANGTVYVGEWRNGFMEGYGTMVDAEDGTRYTGEGLMTSVDGSEYAGGWFLGEKCGRGTMKYADGSKFVGKWTCDKRREGEMRYSDGSTYIGGWHNDIIFLYV
eukprot:gene22321-28439_t